MSPPRKNKLGAIRRIPTALSRRALLRGFGGVAVGLPALELMGFGGRAHGQSASPPNRFLVAYGGISTGLGSDQVVPDTVGRNYDVKRGLKALTDLGIRDDVSIVSGLHIPWAEAVNATPPPGGRNRFFHGNTVGAMLAGTRCWREPDGYNGTPRAPTCDQLVADAIAGNTLRRVLAYRVQPVSYSGDNNALGNGARLSWKARPPTDKDYATNPVMVEEPFASPRVAYTSLFQGFAPSTNTADVEKVRFLLKQRRSVLDFVSDDMTRLMATLGSADRQRMQQHYDEIRALELRLGNAPASGGDTGCMSLPPPSDPPLGTAIHSGDNVYATTAGYSNEDLRADLFADLIAMAFTCDISRSVSFMLTFWKCYMNMFQVAGWKSDMHQLTHGAGPLESVSDSVNWHLKQWGKVVTRLKAVREPTGGTLLDRTAMALVYEGGWGYDPEAKRNNSAHSTENMIALVGGRAGGLKAGQHVKASGKHVAQAVLSAMNAAGYKGTSLGEVSGNIPQLFS